jgi:hypothetical protein
LCALLCISHVGFHVFKMADPSRWTSNSKKISHILNIWKVHIFRHLFVCFQNSVYTLRAFHKNRNNSTVFEELSLSIGELTVANIRETAFATVKSITDTSKTSNSVLLFLNSKTQYNFNAISIHIQKKRKDLSTALIVHHRTLYQFLVGVNSFHRWYFDIALRCLVITWRNKAYEASIILLEQYKWHEHFCDI